MTITQTVEIPANRRVFIDIPREISTGKARVLIFPVADSKQPTLKADAASSKGNKKIGMTRTEIDEFLKNAHTPISDSLLGILKTDMTLAEIRMARLAKHL